MTNRLNLPDIQFADKSAEQIEADILAEYEKLTGVQLSQADPRRKMIQAYLPILVQQRNLIDFGAKQNLLAYANDEFIDHIGSTTDTKRLEPTSAKTLVRFTLSLAQSENKIIPLGTRATVNGISFETKEEIIVFSGATFVDVEMQCTEPGEMGNGFLPGQIKELVDPLPWIESVINLTISNGGTDWEDDDVYANRIQKSPEKYSTAGPEGAYDYWARTASPLIADVFVRTPSPGVVEIHPLLRGGGIPDENMLALVYETCSHKKVRPLTDFVRTVAPEIVTYGIEVTYWISSDKTAFSASIQHQVNLAVQEYISWQKEKLGRDIDPSELIARMKNAGASRVAVTSPVYTPLEKHQVAKEENIRFQYGGLTNG